jgi:hypothetical protein
MCRVPKRRVRGCVAAVAGGCGVSYGTVFAHCATGGMARVEVGCVDVTVCDRFTTVDCDESNGISVPSCGGGLNNQPGCQGQESRVKSQDSRLDSSSCELPVLVLQRRTK